MRKTFGVFLKRTSAMFYRPIVVRSLTSQTATCRSRRSSEARIGMIGNALSEALQRTPPTYS